MLMLSDFPQLRLLAWCRPGAEAIDEEEAFALYERNWHHVDEAALEPAERALIDRLVARFGHGVMNV